ncbi:hypothetical protein F4212_15935 [Candidatus Poribacteria bacterium]|nr:hypothetical protein [Candidatus Poribacteria bacterium]
MFLCSVRSTTAQTGKFVLRRGTLFFRNAEGTEDARLSESQKEEVFSVFYGLCDSDRKYSGLETLPQDYSATIDASAVVWGV